MSSDGSPEGGVPQECQLCKALEHHDDIREPTHTTQIPRDDGGIKFIYHCRRCGEELWDTDDTEVGTDRLDSMTNQGEA